MLVEESEMPTLAEKEKFYTYIDYEQLPEGAPYQLIGGQLVLTPAPEPYHQKVSLKIVSALFRFVTENGLGEVFTAPIDVFLTNTETYQPDIIYISKENTGIISEKKIEGPPDLVVEILSPSTAYYDLKHKKKVYEQTGVKEYWIVDPMEKSIEIYKNTDRGFVLIERKVAEGKVTSNLLKNFSLNTEDIF
ncbi:MAG: Uma2 family endonuclease [Nitrospirae bacterium]|nr:MAG: Uma2 family endonuclease [Nitrospirota bacterium]